MTEKAGKSLRQGSRNTEVDAFLKKVAAMPRIKPGGRYGRLIFAMDATASREPTWDRACHLQAQMFQETAALGGLEIQLCYYRGFKEFFASPWVRHSDALLKQMTAVSCLGGYTQIERVLQHARDEARKQKVNALVFVGDCMEENVDRLCHIAGELGVLGIPVFVFQEGHDPVAEQAFRQIAQLTQGAYCRFNAASAAQLRDLLSAVAVYATGGRHALENFSQRQGGVTLQLIHQVKKD
ncbi:conserved hypothetical protein [Nitrosococcus halophilus Nc 4]|uniref:VWA domain-containing protein n=1 Tax=Nitrosococcus halophilus (strain Nc4) TaxID=472759 RepID=D5C4G4_NITHN|nr:hypothetical protein [Nitrosococcus halophilus]ADE15148.1 conserved hypothetical protein [Nitrosococcus halophilus Nc 4]